MIGFLGDVHSQEIGVKKVIAAIEEHNKNCVEFNNPEKIITALIQVGDWGIKSQYMNTIKPSIPIYWIDGNHEDYEYIRRINSGTTPVNVSENIFYVPRGTVLELDGRRIAFMGGAASVDKAWRTPGKDWFPDENITLQQIRKLDTAKNIDILVTHVPPQSIIRKHFNPLNLLMFGLSVDWVDPNAVAVEDIWKDLGYPQIFCGHMHQHIVDDKCTILDINELIAF